MTHRFMEIEPVALDRADVAVLSFPFEGSVSYGTGTAAGPASVLVASQHLETWDEDTEQELEDVLRVCALEPIAPHADEASEEYLERLTREVRSMAPRLPFPLSLGGEHSITPAILKGLVADPSPLTIVQIDAHADLRHDYGGSRYNHACAMRQTLDLGVRRLVAIGIRSAEREEARLAREDPRIDTFYAHRLQTPAAWRTLVQKLEGLQGPVYLTIDIDGLDCTLCPGTGTPQPGGLTWYQAVDVVRAVVLAPGVELVGADIMETAPMSQSQINEMVAAKLAMKILAYRQQRAAGQ